MSLTPEFLDTVCHALANGNARRPGVDAELREAFPGLVFKVCDDNDIPSRLKPVAEGEGFALYAINTGEHCAALTAQLEGAGGLAIGLLNDEE
ncbi:MULTISPECIES: DUF6129 family protein [Uliginosibacterium]|uniref:DUF6129 domain-containing protein n=1 Tax=Uliginosibacterium aquaticum TaxID=2731212 RepID=A0ABX2IJA3_9RHOO|nr:MULTISPECIES: DUF6129 family protein [Uliginosibacterium]MDO6388070.1 DUF6129 family protein [Uliginosibacterium sp. 31-12]NSL54714.1 hypothetical protein [Uliginosibacterium aquaticum]